eukprot:4960046-Karenia_brevis.AAC.1
MPPQMFQTLCLPTLAKRAARTVNKVRRVKPLLSAKSPCHNGAQEPFLKSIQLTAVQQPHRGHPVNAILNAIHVLSLGCGLTPQSLALRFSYLMLPP